MIFKFIKKILWFKVWYCTCHVPKRRKSTLQQLQWNKLKFHIKFALFLLIKETSSKNTFLFQWIPIETRSLHHLHRCTSTKWNQSSNSKQPSHSSSLGNLLRSFPVKLHSVGFSGWYSSKSDCTRFKTRCPELITTVWLVTPLTCSKTSLTWSNRNSICNCFTWSRKSPKNSVCICWPAFSLMTLYLRFTTYPHTDYNRWHRTFSIRFSTLFHNCVMVERFLRRSLMVKTIVPLCWRIFICILKDLTQL